MRNITQEMDRRDFVGLTGKACVALAASLHISAKSYGAGGNTALADHPNVILAMTDDQGWGDSGYNGHPVLRTPTLDAMAKSGVRFNRFYAASPVCSPTRGSCLTGRHPYRYGIFFANAARGTTAPSRYPLPGEEVTLAEVLKRRGYTTGHFGKWHLGDFDGPKQSSPADNGFDECFSTIRKVATLDPEGYFENGRLVTDPLEGDDSKIIMDRALAFIRKAVEGKKPFLAVIWFHTPHRPVVAAPSYKAIYSDHSEGRQNYWGTLTAMDEQMGRLRRELRSLDVADNTMLWFCSDNGPEGDREDDRGPGSTGGLRGRKRSLFEGGVRVPGILEWPARIRSPRTVDAPCCTSDYYPTILQALGIKVPNQPRPLDGISIWPLIEGKSDSRPSPIAFETQGNTRGSPRLALTDNRYKLLTNLEEGDDVLFDLLADPAESNNLADEKPEIAGSMRDTLQNWRTSCKRSLAGKDYR